MQLGFAFSICAALVATGRSHARLHDAALVTAAPSVRLGESPLTRNLSSSHLRASTAFLRPSLPHNPLLPTPSAAEQLAQLQAEAEALAAPMAGAFAEVVRAPEPPVVRPPMVLPTTLTVSQWQWRKIQARATREPARHAPPLCEEACFPCLRPGLFLLRL